MFGRQPSATAVPTSINNDVFMSDTTNWQTGLFNYTNWWHLPFFKCRRTDNSTSGIIEERRIRRAWHSYDTHVCMCVCLRVYMCVCACVSVEVNRRVINIFCVEDGVTGVNALRNFRCESTTRDARTHFERQEMTTLLPVSSRESHCDDTAWRFPATIATVLSSTDDAPWFRYILFEVRRRAHVHSGSRTFPASKRTLRGIRGTERANGKHARDATCSEIRFHLRAVDDVAVEIVERFALVGGDDAAAADADADAGRRNDAWVTVQRRRGNNITAAVRLVLHLNRTLRDQHRQSGCSTNKNIKSSMFCLCRLNHL